MRVGVGGSHKAVLPRGIEDELTPPALTRCTTNEKILQQETFLLHEINWMTPTFLSVAIWAQDLQI